MLSVNKYLENLIDVNSKNREHGLLTVSLPDSKGVMPS